MGSLSSSNGKTKLVMAVTNILMTFNNPTYLVIMNCINPKHVELTEFYYT